MTINQPVGMAAATPDAGADRAGTPRRKIILADVVLVLVAGVVEFVATALIPPIGTDGTRQEVRP